MRRSGRTIWVLLWLTAVLGALGAAPARAAEKERVLLLGVVEDHDHMDGKLTEALLARLRGEPEAILRGEDVTKTRRKGCEEIEDPGCFSELAQKEKAQAVLIVSVNRQADKQLLLRVQLFDMARNTAKGPSDEKADARGQLEKLTRMVQTALKQRREAPPLLATSEPALGSPPPPYAPGGVVELTPQGTPGASAPAAAVARGGNDLVVTGEPKSTHLWKRMTPNRRWLVVGLGIASIGLIAGATALTVLDNKPNMGPCTYDGNSDYRNCVTDYRGLYGTMFAAGGVGVIGSIYLVLKK